MQHWANHFRCKKFQSTRVSLQSSFHNKYAGLSYKLLHVLAPLFLFVNAAEPDKNDFKYAVIFALLLIPKSYFFRIFAGIPPDVSLGVVINPALMLALSWLIIKDGLLSQKNVSLRGARSALPPAKRPSFKARKCRFLEVVRERGQSRSFAKTGLLHPEQRGSQ